MRSGSRLRNVERGNRVAGWVVYNTTVAGADLLRAEGLSQGQRSEQDCDRPAKP